MIKFSNITKAFNENKVIDNITGTFETGKINMVIGASGTGKSVLIKCMVGLIPLDGGEIYFDDDEFSKNKNIIRRKIGMLFQGGALFDSKTVQENVMFPLNILTKMSLKEKITRVKFCLDKVGLEDVSKKMPSELSGGMKKRVGIARAIVNNPKYLFVDEPNSGLDPKTSTLIDELIRGITYEYSMTTVIISHDINSMLTIGDNIIFMSEGKKAWEGNKDNVFKSEVEEFNNFLLSNSLAKMMMNKKENK